MIKIYTLHKFIECHLDKPWDWNTLSLNTFKMHVHYKILISLCLSYHYYLILL